MLIPTQEHRPIYEHSSTTNFWWKLSVYEGQSIRRKLA